MGPLFSELQDLPYKMRQKREQQEHEDAAYPDQEVQTHLGIINLFLVHLLTVPLERSVTHRVWMVDSASPIGRALRFPATASLSYTARTYD
jgi:hypothetical protein